MSVDVFLEKEFGEFVWLYTLWTKNTPKRFVISFTKPSRFW